MTMCYFMVSSLQLQAQYYYLPFTNNPGQNPGGLNTDSEYPVGGGLPAGWTSIHPGNAATPAWSTTATLPFAFNFNGNPVSQFKVSTSGVLTFTTSAATAPAYANTAIPSASIPDNSIMVWGVSGNGTNDNICTKTFGTAPNRQHWVFFTSYTAPGTTCWVYWSIVFEEGTDNIYIVDQRNGGCTQSVTAGIQIDASTAFPIVGSPNLNNLSTTDFTPADNQYYKFVAGTQAASEAELTDLDVQQYVLAPANVSIGGTITNYGASPINTITIKYESGGTTYTDVKGGLNVAFSQTYNFTHNTNLSIPATGNYDVNVWIELAGDVNLNNDSLFTTVHALSFFPTKHVVFEEATGTWCGWCPRGTVFMDSLKNLYPNTTELIAVHNNDPMEVTIYDAGMGTLIGGYPSGLVDRNDLDIDPSDFIDYYQTRITDVAPCDVNVVALFDAVTRNIDITVSATFATELNGDFRFNAVVVEDGVTGIGDGTNANNQDYDQVNYYSFQSNNLPLQGAGHNWQTETNPVPATTMVYDHVGRAILGGFNGQAGSLPVSIPINSTQSYNFNYVLPVAYDETQVHVIGWVSDGSTNVILNANHGDLTTGIEDNVTESKDFSIRILGNPSSNSLLKLTLDVNSDVQMDVFDALGNIVCMSSMRNLSAGEYVYDLYLNGIAAGIYNVRVIANGQSLVARVVVTD